MHAGLQACAHDRNVPSRTDQRPNRNTPEMAQSMTTIRAELPPADPA
jgi:hypothetical protein